MVSQKEITEALRKYGYHGHVSVFQKLADRIAAEGIAPPDGVVLVPSKLSDRQLRVIIFALHRVSSQAHERASIAGLKNYSGSPNDMDKFLDDAKDAEETAAIIRGMLAAAPKGVSDEQ